ncbi:TPA: hypothetical protein G8V58_004608, partial [Salmonella enterica]|nr:hypothetical protein [Salmonella enterica]
EAIQSAVSYIESKGIVIGEFEIVSEKALVLSAQEQALKSYREKGGNMPTETYLWG